MNGAGDMGVYLNKIMEHKIGEIYQKIIKNLEDNMDMTVKEAQVLKKKFEDRLKDAIERFNEKTGVRVDGIDLGYISDIIGGKICHSLIHLKIKTEL